MARFALQLGMPLILYRYIAREILLSTLTIGGVLLLIITGSRFARYLNNAAEGEIGLNVLGQLTLLYMPYAIQLILPLSFILGVMLTFSRLYMENEMAVIQSSGVGQRQLLSGVMVLSMAMALLAGVCSLYITPQTQALSEEVIQTQKQRTSFELLTPGRFTHLGQQGIYAEDLSADKAQLEHVLIAAVDEQGRNTLILAQQGTQQVAPNTLSRFLVLQQGHRYILPIKGQAVESLAFDRFAQRIATFTPPSVPDEAEMLSTLALLKRDDLAAKAQLQWRLALPMMLPVMMLIALPMSQVAPRQGRFGALLPVVMMLLIFLFGMLSLQKVINEGDWPLMPGLWILHGLFTVIGLLMCWRRGVFRSGGGRR